MNRLKRNITIIKALDRLSPKQFKAVIQHSDKDLLFCISNIIHNVSTGKIPVKKATLNKLKRYRKEIYKLCDRKVSLPQRKKILIQRGAGILSILLPTVIGSLISLIAGKKKKGK